jgi:uncharacterized membrane protein
MHIRKKRLTSCGASLFLFSFLMKGISFYLRFVVLFFVDFFVVFLAVFLAVVVVVLVAVAVVVVAGATYLAKARPLFIPSKLLAREETVLSVLLPE